MFEATPLAWHNGRIVERERAAPSIASHSLHLGIGIFDGLMAYCNGDHYHLHYADEHLARLRRGSTHMGLTYPWTDGELKTGIRDLLDAVEPMTYYIRPIVYRPGPQINVTGARDTPTDVAIFGVVVPRDVDRALRCHVSPVERVSSRAIPVGWKICGTYVNSYLARRAAQEAGFDDGVMLDAQGYVAELSAANLFLVRGLELISPAMTPDIFPGITRQVVLAIAEQLGITASERPLRSEELGDFEAAFAASTLMELKPIQQIDSHTYEATGGRIFARIWEAFREITHR